ncbi:hypothetical protein F2Q68_00025571 [Brassica cretica]|uniref:Uncharacterized protein n=1 Tax=Brassica cretica TaxID=69181 RepID=A0A8S9I7W9_BRACR|nr:hypothetical protein F2Q68_00025571 [Brassica cretica]
MLTKVFDNCGSRLIPDSNSVELEGHLCNGACRKIDDQGAVIPDPEADALQAVLEAKNTAANAHSAQPRTLAEYLLDNS